MIAAPTHRRDAGRLRRRGRQARAARASATRCAATAPQRDGIGLYWKALGRNKRSVALDLHVPEAQALLLRWLPQFDVFVENFRPGTLERWNLAPERMLGAGAAPDRAADDRVRPGRSVPRPGRLRHAVRGDDRDRRGLGLGRPPAAAAGVSAGRRDGGPSRDAPRSAPRTRGGCGPATGEIIDFAIYEAVMKLVESQITEYAANGTLHRRLGNRMEDTAPRGAYRCGDGAYVALSGSTQAVAERVLRTLGGDGAGGRPALRDQRRAGRQRRRARRADRGVLRGAHARRGDRDVHRAPAARSGRSRRSIRSSPTRRSPRAARSRRCPTPSWAASRSPTPSRASRAPARRRCGPGRRRSARDTAAVLARDLGLGEDELQALASGGRLGAPAHGSAALRAVGSADIVQSL